MVTRRLRWGIASVWVLVGLASTWTLGVGMRWRSYVRSPLPEVIWYEEHEPVSEVPVTLEVNRPGMENPPFADAQDERISRAMRVIGVLINGEAYAYSIKALSIPPGWVGTDVFELARRHVVNQLLGTTAISVTYCDMSTCARVFKMEDRSHALPLGISGARGERMVLQYADKQYMQDSKQIPLEDSPFEIMTWGDWVSRHPASRIYLGGS
jgi:hypothetical protein